MPFKKPDPFTFGQGFSLPEVKEALEGIFTWLRQNDEDLATIFDVVDKQNLSTRQNLEYIENLLLGQELSPLVKIQAITKLSQVQQEACCKLTQEKLDKVLARPSSNTNQGQSNTMSDSPINAKPVPSLYGLSPEYLAQVEKEVIEENKNESISKERPTTSETSRIKESDAYPAPAETATPKAIDDNKNKATEESIEEASK